MEKGLKNLAQAYRASQRNKGTVDGHYDSGIGVSDLEEESEERTIDMQDPESSTPFQNQYTQQRVPSIQSMLGQYPAMQGTLPQHHTHQQPPYQ
jgi:hypothetical protein